MKKGFTIIELIVTFSLISVIVILLFQLIISLREIYVSSEVKTTILSKQAIMTNKIEGDLEDKTATRIISCGENCINITYSDSKSYDLNIDKVKNTITYNNYTWKLMEGSKIGTIEVSNHIESGITNSKLDNAILTIKIPVTNKIVEGDLGINIVYQYNNLNVNVSNSFPIVN